MANVQKQGENITEPATDFKDKKPVKWKSSDELIKENEELFKKDLYKQQLADKRAKLGAASERGGSAGTSETTVPRGEYAKTIPGGYPTVKQPKLLTDEEKQAFGGRKFVIPGAKERGGELGKIAKEKATARGRQTAEKFNAGLETPHEEAFGGKEFVSRGEEKEAERGLKREKKSGASAGTSENSSQKADYAKLERMPGGLEVKQPKLLTDEEKQAFGEKGEAPGSVKGSWNRLQARLSAMRKLQKDVAEGGQFSLVGTQMLNQAAEKAVKQVWYAIHEAVEAIVIWSLFLLSPLAVALVFIRIIGYLGLNHFFSVRFRGIEVKPFPGPGWGDISRVKTILACIITLIMILIIYILTNPCESIGSVFGEGAAKVFSSACKLFGLH